MNFRDVGVKKMDEAFSKDKMWSVRKIFCLVYCRNSYRIRKKINKKKTKTTMNFLVPSTLLKFL